MINFYLNGLLFGMGLYTGWVIIKLLVFIVKDFFNY